MSAAHEAAVAIGGADRQNARMDQNWIAEFVSMNHGAPVVPIGEVHRAALEPATHCVYEWVEYRFTVEGATHLKIGTQWLECKFPGSFLYTFTNQLGLASITPYANGLPLAETLYVEVLSSKLGTPDQSIRFLKSMLAEIFAFGSSLPFHTAAPTMRWVRDSSRPPNDLFVYHFFRWHRETVLRAIQAILASPHRVLADEELFVRPHEVRHVEVDTILHMLQSGRAQPGPATMTPLQRLRPERVLQRIPVETYDTPENRFGLSASRRMLDAIERLEKRTWFQRDPVTETDRQRIGEVKQYLSALIQDPRFDGLQESTRFPAQSRVLQRRDGYRDVSLLWQQFQRARSPVFQKLETAIDLRDVASMYELWCLFALIAEIKSITGIEPRISEDVNEFGNPEHTFNAMFGGIGTLHYNKTYTGYSGIKLRPDYVWELPTGDLIVIDAKFRLHKLSEFFVDETTGESIQTSKSKDDDLQKMHTYRDAIHHVVAAIVIYPGTQSRFRNANGIPRLVDVDDIVRGEISGIGAIPMRPMAEEIRK